MCLRERWANTTRTSRATFIKPRTEREDGPIDTHNGDAGEGAVELQDVLVIETTDGKKNEYEIVALIESDDGGENYAVAYSKVADEFIVTDARGDLLQDDALAQEILDDFIVFAEESAAEEN